MFGGASDGSRSSLHGVLLRIGESRKGTDSDGAVGVGDSGASSGETRAPSGPDLGHLLTSIGAASQGVDAEYTQGMGESIASAGGEHAFRGCPIGPRLAPLLMDIAAASQEHVIACEIAADNDAQKNSDAAPSGNGVACEDNGLDAEDQVLESEDASRSFLHDLSMTSGSQWKVVKRLQTEASRYCRDEDDAVAILTRLSKLLLARSPDAMRRVADNLTTERKPRTKCRCVQLFSAIGSFRQSPLVTNSNDVRLALDASLSASGLTREAGAQHGLNISKKAWRNARRTREPQADDDRKRRGRPSMVHNADCIDIVRTVAMANSQESTKLIHVFRRSSPGAKAVKEAVLARSWTSSKHCIYLTNSSLFIAMSYQTWCRILAFYFPEIRKGAKKTDVCDHCHLYQAHILPEFWSFTRDVRERLTAVDQKYFHEFDKSRRVLKASQDPLKYARCLSSYIKLHMDRCRARLMESIGLKGVGRLHELEAEFEDALRWQSKLLSAYDWHRRSFVFLATFVAKPWNEFPRHPRKHRVSEA
jgi:hypothetical protein